MDSQARWSWLALTGVVVIGVCSVAPLLWTAQSKSQRWREYGLCVTVVAGAASIGGCVGRAILIDHGADLWEPMVTLVCVALCYALRRRIAVRP